MAYLKKKRMGMKRKGGRHGKGHGKGHSRIPRAPRLRHQAATIVETIRGLDFLPNQTYDCTFSLNQFNRASSLAPFFKYYKPVKCVWSFEPLFNTYQETVGGAQTVPYIYKVMNRTQDASDYVLSDIQAMGSQPVKFTKVMHVGYTPNWCTPGLVSNHVDSGTGDIDRIAVTGNTPNYAYTMCPNTNALATSTGIIDAQFNPNQMLNVQGNLTVFNGHLIYIDQAASGVSGPICRVTLTVTWSFKDPNNTTGLTAPAPSLKALPSVALASGSPQTQSSNTQN